MIAITAVLETLHIDQPTLDFWLAEGWLRPRREFGLPIWEPIDVARLHLIVDLRTSLALPDDAVPVILSLLDQLHATRTQLHRLCDAMQAEPDRSVAELVRRLSGT